MLPGVCPLVTLYITKRSQNQTLHSMGLGGHMLLNTTWQKNTPRKQGERARTKPSQAQARSSRNALTSNKNNTSSHASSGVPSGETVHHRLVVELTVHKMVLRGRILLNTTWQNILHGNKAHTQS